MDSIILAILMLNVGLSFTLSIAYATLRSDTRHLNGKFNALATDFKSFRSEMTDFKQEMLSLKKEMLDFKKDWNKSRIR